MSSQPELKAVIFDLDGVLVDTGVLHAAAWANLVRGLGHEPPADLEEKVKGIPRMASLRIALGEHVAEYTEPQLQEYAANKNAEYQKEVEKLTPDAMFEGVAELFDDLESRGIRIALGSASRNAIPVLEKLGLLHRFDVIVDGHKFTHGKPHPDVFLTGAAELGLAPHECIVVEDAAAGITAALDGGFVAVGLGNYESLKHAHLFITSLLQIDAEALIDRHARYRPDRWAIVRDGVHEDREPSLHTIFCVGNGRIGVRGRIPELPVGGDSGVFVAGLYDRVERQAPDPDKWGPFLRYWGVGELARSTQIEAHIINGPDLLDAAWTIDGERVDFTTGRLESLRRRLDLRTGMFTAEATWTSPAGKRLRLVQRRIADLVNTARVFVQYEIKPLNFTGEIEMIAGVRGDAQTLDQSICEPRKADTGGERGVAVRIEGNRDHRTAAFGTTVWVADQPEVDCRRELELPRPTIRAAFTVTEGKVTYVERACVVADDRREDKPLAAATQALAHAESVSFERARIDHAAAWQQLWDDSDVRIDGPLDDQLAARFSVFQLLINASRDDAGVSIPAKGITGPGYRGMVFWDTDIHMTPFFIFTQPGRARNLLTFRHRTLDGARAKAGRYGFRGAMYPWETGYSGEEETEKWLRLITHQVHITADVVYAMMQYVEATRDMAFYEDRAAEVLIETARFWVSKAEDRGEFLSIPEAGGPDEYHVAEDDSAYVNNLAIRNLRWAIAAADHLKANTPDKWEALARRIGLTDGELARFADYAGRIRTMLHEDGRFEQCDGFFELDDERVTEGDRERSPHTTTTVKQADVIMLLCLLPDEWGREVMEANYDYYEPRTVHASSLSHAAYGMVALELGRMDQAEQYVRRSMGMDLADEMNNAASGAHMAATGMNWVGIVRGFGGARPQGERFLVAPRLPASWKRLEFGLKWRGADFTVNARPDGVTVTNDESAAAPLPLRLADREVDLAPGESAEA